MSIETNIPKKNINFCCKASVLLNALTINFVIVYFIIPISTIIHDIFGLVLIVSWLLNILLIHQIDKRIIKTSDIGKKINRYSFVYIIVFIVGILLLAFGVILLSFPIMSILLSYTLILAGSISISGLGLMLAVITSSNLEKRGVWSF